MPVFRIEVAIMATAYVKADDEESARRRLLELDGETFEHASRDQQLTDDLWISGRQYDDPDLPDVALSPAMTLRVPSDSDAENVDDS